jgi:hypothetical protein
MGAGITGGLFIIFSPNVLRVDPTEARKLS